MAPTYFTYDGTTVTAHFDVVDPTATYGMAGGISDSASNGPFAVGAHTLSMATTSPPVAGDYYFLEFFSSNTFVVADPTPAGTFLIQGTASSMDPVAFNYTWDGLQGPGSVVTCQIRGTAPAHTYQFISEDGTSVQQPTGGPGATLTITDVYVPAGPGFFVVRVQDNNLGPEGCGQHFFISDFAGVIPPSSANEGIRIAFSSNAYDADPFWTRIDDPSYPDPGNSGSINVVSAWSTDRGRQYEMDKTQAGTATITIKDTTGILDASNPNSPFFGQITPMKQVKITVQNPVDGSYHDIFTGFTETWTWDIDPSEKLLTVTLSCTDGFEPLARAETVPDSTGTTIFAGGVHPDARIGFALDMGGWPALQRNLYSGNVFMQPTVYNPQTSILSVIQDAADAEFPNVANVFMDRWGRVAFRGRWARFYPEYYSSRDLHSNPPPGFQQGYFWFVGDNDAANTFGYIPISSANQDSTDGTSGGIQWANDLKDVINTTLVTPSNIVQGAIAAQRLFNSTSINNYGIRFLSLPDLLIESSIPGPSVGPPTHAPGGDGVGAPSADANTECKIIGQYFIDNYSQPAELIKTLTFDSRSPTDSFGPQLWAFLTGVEIGDVVVVTQKNPGGGGFKANQFFVEGIHNTVSLGGKIPQWTMTLDLSPRSWYRKFNGVTYYTGN